VSSAEAELFAKDALGVIGMEDQSSTRVFDAAHAVDERRFAVSKSCCGRGRRVSRGR